MFFLLISVSALFRGIARQLQRGFRGYLHFGGRNQNAASGPNNLLSFLSGNGPHAQELISRSLRQGTPMLVDFGYAILDSLENEVSEMDNSVMGSGKFATFILNLIFFPRIDMLKKIVLKQSCDELWFLKKCQNCTFKVVRSKKKSLEKISI